MSNSESGALISIVVPLYNEAENIDAMYKSIKNVFNKLSHEFELVFVDDGSVDNSADELAKLCKKDARVKVVELVRNFGKEIALTAGLNESSGDAAIMIDADLQHPPDLIPEFVRKWEEGADVVVGVRKKYREALPKKLFSGSFYKLMTLVSETRIMPNATDFRMVDRQVIDAFNRFTERNRITRGLFDWLGYRHEVVPFDALTRHAGRASYNFRKRARLGLHSFVGHSLFPLRLAGYIGLLIIFTSGPLGLFIFVNKYLLHDLTGYNFSGPAILAVINLFLSGITLTCLGMIALYIANIHQEVINRPLYLVRKNRKSVGQKAS